jgi:DNA-binding NarL/FixJ family response regulator
VIAGASAVSVKTVETHRGAIMRNLGIGFPAELTRFAIRNGIVDP